MKNTNLNNRINTTTTTNCSNGNGISFIGRRVDDVGYNIISV